MNSSGRYYFDWAATAIPDFPYNGDVSVFGNPSSLHAEGRRARIALEEARSRCAQVLGVPANHIYFTSGGTESNALVIHSALPQRRASRILISSVEHPSIGANCSFLERMGKQTGSIGVEKDGRVTAITLEKALAKHADARFIAIMGVNNETGAVMDLPVLASLIRARGGVPIHIHSDLVQALGKIPVDLSGWDLDSASISAHKLGGPRGIGILYLRKPLEPIYTGGGQERGIRPGTENTAGALTMADCLERRGNPLTVKDEYEKASWRFKTLIGFLKSLDRCSLLPTDRQEEDARFSPYILQVAFKGIPGEVMVRALDDAGFAVSTGSACASASKKRPVLAAMGIDERTGFEGIRISQGWSTTLEDIEQLIRAITEILKSL